MAENFTFIYDDYATDNVVKTGEYKFGSSTLAIYGQGEQQYELQQDRQIRINGKTVNCYKAGSRHPEVNRFSRLPEEKNGTLTIFTPAAAGMFTVYFNTSANIRVNTFKETAAEPVEFVDADSNITEYSFKVTPGYTYVMSTTGKTNNMSYGGYRFIEDKEIILPLEIRNIDAKKEDVEAMKLIIEDAELATEPFSISANASELKLMEGHTYRVKSSASAVKTLSEKEDCFTATEGKAVITLHYVPDEELTGEITGVAAGIVQEIFFENMANGERTKGEVSGSSYRALLKPGEYRTIIKAVNNEETRDRVSVKAGVINTNEVYVEPLKVHEEDCVEYKSEISIPEDYASLNEASRAICLMKNRPQGEEGRVTIYLHKDIFEQTVMDADYVTIKGMGHTISWYYGVGTRYYSVEPETGLYSESLLRDRYSSEEGNGALWGGVFIARGNNLIAENTIFKNTYNYDVTEAERRDIEGSNLSVDRLSPDADVTAHVYKERSNAFYIDADRIELYNCQILSSQDTFGRNGAENHNYHIYLKNCTIGGNVDYICGEFTAVFDNCKLQWKTFKGDEHYNGVVGFIVAPKTSPYVFRNCMVTTDGAAGDIPVCGKLGRTWGKQSRAAFINCETNGLIDAEGWGEMSAGDLSSAFFYEYGLKSNGSSFETSARTGCSYDDIKDYIDTEERKITDVLFEGWMPVHYDC